MNHVLRLTLQTSAEQRVRLQALQSMFAQACNELAQVAQEQRCWNRVALHHLAYKRLRERYPTLGSQMVCNAVYSVCRAARLVYQHPQSPFHLSRLGERALPLMRFAENCAVYFDRHTLSVRAGRLSMFTLDGRMRFELALAAGDEQAFHHSKLREVVLARRPDGEYELTFWLQGVAQATEPDPKHPAAAAGPTTPASLEASASPSEHEWPEFLMVEALP